MKYNLEPGNGRREGWLVLFHLRSTKKWIHHNRRGRTAKFWPLLGADGL